MDPLTASAERILSGHFGTRVRLRVRRRLSGGMRVHGDGELLASVVVKVADPGFTNLLFNDWAATELLTLSGCWNEELTVRELRTRRRQ